MKVIAVLAGLLCATDGPDTGEAGHAVGKKEAYLRRLGSCPEEELRRRLDFRFRNNDMLGIWEIMQRKEVYSRVKDGKMDGYFAMLGMMFADGEWHSKYVEAFRRSKLDVPESEEVEAIGRLMKELADDEAGDELTDEEIMDGLASQSTVKKLIAKLKNKRLIKKLVSRRLLRELANEEAVRELMSEMVTGRIWREVNRKPAETALRGLQGKANEARNKTAAPSNVVYHIASGMGKYLRPADRRWGRVLVGLLERHDVRAEAVKGRYNEELMEIMRKDKELEDVLYNCVLKRKGVLGAMVSKNAVLGGEIVGNVVEQGHWLYVDLEDSVEKCAFERMKVRYGDVGTEELSVGGLRRQARGGSLDELVKSVIRRLVKYGRMHDLKVLVNTVGSETFDRLLAGGELDTLLREGIERALGDGRVHDLRRLAEIVKGEVFGRLLGAGELDGALKEGIERLSGDEKMHDLVGLIKIVKGRFDILVGRGELDTVLREKIGRLVRDRWYMHDLKWLTKIVGDEVLDRLLGAGELKKCIGELIAGRQVYGLRELMGIEAVKRRVSGGLLSREELDSVRRLVEGT